MGYINPFYRVFICLKDCKVSETALILNRRRVLRRLIWFHSVFSGLSVQILRVNAVTAILSKETGYTFKGNNSDMEIFTFLYMKG